MFFDPFKMKMGKLFNSHILLGEALSLSFTYQGLPVGKESNVSIRDVGLPINVLSEIRIGGLRLPFLPDPLYGRLVERPA